MVRRIVGQLFTWLGVLVLFGFSVIRTMLDVIGYSTASADAQGIPQATQALLGWLYSLPWLVPWGVFLVAFMWLAWWSWSPHSPPIVTPESGADALKQKRPVQREKLASETSKSAQKLPKTPDLSTGSKPTQPRRAKPLTAHAVERKLKVIDEALDLLKEVQPMLDRGPKLLRETWHTTGESGVVPYVTLVQSLIDSIREYSSRVDHLRNENQEYQDVMLAMQQTYFNETIQELVVFHQGCEAATKAIAAGATMATVYHPMVGDRVGHFEQALARMESWRNRARGDLADLRTATSPV